MMIPSIPNEWLPRYTYKDYEKWEGNWELIYGYPYAMSPSPFYKHQAIGSQFIFLAGSQIQKQASSCNCRVIYELDWVIDELTIVRPDVMIICNAVPADFVRTPPVLILEIFSTNTRMKDRNLKFKLYEENGVKYYLMADPEKNTLEIFILKNNQYQEINTSTFQLTSSCTIDLDFSALWQ